MDGSIGDEGSRVFTAAFYSAIGFGRSIQNAFEQGKTELLLAGINEDKYPKLLPKADVNPSKINFVGELYPDMPAEFKDLVNSGSYFIDIPDTLNDTNENEYMYFKLEMAHAGTISVFRVAKSMEIADAAHYLVKELVSHEIRGNNYKWTLNYNDKDIPFFHTFKSIQPSKPFFLVGVPFTDAWQFEWPPPNFGQYGYFTDTGRAFKGASKGFSKFRVKINSNNNGIILVRRSNYSIADQKANVFVDGTQIEDEVWFNKGSDDINRWRNHILYIPENLKGKRCFKFHNRCKI
jgi:hypothetical protein